MAVPDIIACLRRVGYAVPTGAFRVMLDNEDAPTRALFDCIHAKVDNKALTQERRILQDADRELVRRAVLLQRSGWRLAGSARDHE